MPKIKINVADEGEKKENTSISASTKITPTKTKKIKKTVKKTTRSQAVKTKSKRTGRIARPSSGTTAKRKSSSRRVAVLDEDKKRVKSIQSGRKKIPSQKIRINEEDSVIDNRDSKKLTQKAKRKTVDLAEIKSDAVKNLVASVKRESEEQTEPEIELQAPPPRRLKLYRSIALTFIFFTILLLATLLYLSVVKVTIILVPDQERISNNMIFDVYDKERAAEKNINGLAGVVDSLNLTYKKTYPATGEEVVGREVIGKVVIVNNYIRNQPLVATTRLLSPDGKLYHLKETINVPANGTVTAAVYADEPREEMAISPTKFTIPGLWAGLQDKIYAESKEKFVYKKKVKKHITQEDIDNASRGLKRELLTQAKADVNKAYKDYSQIIYKIDENSIIIEVTGKAGDEIDEFLAKIKADVVVVSFSGQEAAKLARQKFINSLPSNKEMLSFAENNIIYSLNNFDYDRGVATISATFEGRVTLREGTSIINRDKILGLNQKQLNAYLSDLPEIAGFEVKFYPSFIKKVPRLKDRIKVEVKK